MYRTTSVKSSCLFWLKSLTAMVTFQNSDALIFLQAIFGQFYFTDLGQTDSD